ncbi:hypothetical protein WK62_05325 [Burkholderia ubonensis]|uniref:hypothetical protein n=1 Tax=Burkholderia ubonensis TaxID=101571 RepID=UPI000757034C|nr:hypothetical protein [Burkholderia ubonensis]KVU10686.1 hypothetical protein WK62_05325 [Burkholderia ubonensis]
MQTIAISLPIDNSERIRLYEVIDRHTGQRVGKPYATRIAASRRVDKLDNAYGAYRYYTRPIR